jgi:hypothetical protein
VKHFCSSSYSKAIGTLIMLALAGTMAFGQAISGNLTGTILDSSGAALNGAAIDAVNVATGQKVTTTSRGNGGYFFSNLPVGTYRVSATASGFKTTTLDNVTVELNKSNTLNIKLELGTSTTTVEVSGEAPPVDTTTAQLQSTFSDRFSTDLGLTTSGGAGAGVLNLSMLTAGVTNASAMGLGVGPSVGGQRPRDNNFVVEGVDNNN